MCLFIQDILKNMFYSTEVKGTVLLLNAPSSQTSKTMTWIPTMLLSTSSESRPPPVTPPIHLELPPITTLSLQSPPPSESPPPPVTPPIHLELPPITTLSLQSPPPSESCPTSSHSPYPPGTPTHNYSQPAIPAPLREPPNEDALEGLYAKVNKQRTAPPKTDRWEPVCPFYGYRAKYCTILFYFVLYFVLTSTDCL